MSEPEVTAETQAKDNAIPQWRVSYNNFMPMLEDILERLWKTRDTYLAYMEGLDKEHKAD